MAMRIYNTAQAQHGAAAHGAPATRPASAGSCSEYTGNDGIMERLPAWQQRRLEVLQYGMQLMLHHGFIHPDLRPASESSAQTSLCATKDARTLDMNKQTSDSATSIRQADGRVAKQRMAKFVSRRTKLAADTRGRKSVRRSVEKRTRHRQEYLRRQLHRSSPSVSDDTEISDHAMTSNANAMRAEKPARGPAEIAIKRAVQQLQTPLAGDSSQDKPHVLIIATGGTIAGRGESPSHTATYLSGVHDVDEQLRDVRSSLEEIAKISTLQLCKVGSPDMTTKLLIELSHRVQTELARDDLDGIVITHGTDTLEETSFFLDITVDSSKPVVFTGAMFPGSSHGADGPKNVLEAVCTARDPASRDRGVLVVFNGKIMPARSTVKSDANMIETFDPGHQGALGQVVDTRPLWYKVAARPLGHRHFDISSLKPEDDLPFVDVIPSYLGQSPEVFTRAIENNVKGLILAGVGAGCWSNAGGDQLDRCIGPYSIPIVASYRSNQGCVSSKNIFGIPDWVIRSGFLNPWKSCKLLQVCLALGLTNDEIAAAFHV